MNFVVISFVNELGLNWCDAQLFCDNRSEICLSKNQLYYTRTNYIDLRFHKLRFVSELLPREF